MADLNAANLTAALPPPARGDCRLKAEFDGVRGWLVGYRKVSETSESFTHFLNRLSRILENVSGTLIITLLTVIGVLHILIFLFVHRAVYSHELDEGIQWGQRKLREGYALSKDVALGSRDEFHEGRRRRRRGGRRPAPDESPLQLLLRRELLCGSGSPPVQRVPLREPPRHRLPAPLLALGRDKTRCVFLTDRSPCIGTKHDAEGRATRRGRGRGPRGRTSTSPPTAIMRRATA